METIPTLRKLARKSIFHFGRYEGSPVGSIVDTDEYYIAWIYYHIAGISFVDEILEQIHITGELTISKPGMSEEVYEKYRSKIFGDQITNLKDKLMEERGLDEDIAHMVARKKICSNIRAVANACNGRYRREGFAKYWSKGAMQARNHGRANH